MGLRLGNRQVSLIDVTIFIPLSIGVANHQRGRISSVNALGVEITILR
jgi:hypothetical protein